MRQPCDIDILELIPQRRPFVMVDKLIEYNDIVSKTSLNVLDDNLFCRNGVFSQYGILENIAQSCAARIGYKNLSSGGDIKLGFIGAIKDFTADRDIVAGEELTTTIEVLSEVFAMTLVNASVCVDGVEVARCQMKIALEG